MRVGGDDQQAAVLADVQSGVRVPVQRDRDGPLVDRGGPPRPSGTRHSSTGVAVIRGRRSGAEADQWCEPMHRRPLPAPCPGRSCGCRKLSCRRRVELPAHCSRYERAALRATAMTCERGFLLLAALRRMGRPASTAQVRHTRCDVLFLSRYWPWKTVAAVLADLDHGQWHWRASVGPVRSG